MKQRALTINFFYAISLLLFLSTSIFSKALEKETFTFICSEWPPFEYKTNDGKASGYSIEILEAITKELNIKEKIVFYPWKRAYIEAQKEKNNLLFTMARTKEREKLFKWVGPIAPRKIYLWKLKERKDIDVKNWKDVQKYIVGTVRGEAGEKELLNKGFIIGENIYSTTNQLQNFKMLYLKRIGFLYGLEFSTIYGLKKAGYNPSKVQKSLLLSEDYKYYYGFSLQTSDKVVEKFQKAFEIIKNNGTFDKIVEKYKNAN